MTPLEAAAGLAARYGIRHREAVVLKDGSNLLVHLAPAPVILRIATFTAAVRGDPLPYLRREAALVSHLASADASVMPPSDLVPAGPHVVGGWAMNAWRYVDHERGAVPDPVTALGALDDLHATLRDFPSPMPYLNPVLDDLDRALAFGLRHELFTSAQVASTRVRRDGLVVRLQGLAPDVQALHGDAFARNSLMTATGVLWIDFEDCCSGPVVWDLATLVRQPPDERIARIVRERHGEEALATAIELRALQVAVWTVLYGARERLMTLDALRRPVDT